MDLNARREEIITEHRAQQKHDPFWRDEAQKGRPLAERPIAFLCDDEVVLTGDCAQKVLDGLQRFVDEHGWEYEDVETAAGKEYFQRHGYATARKVLAQAGGKGQGELRVNQQRFNGIAFCLGEVGLAVVLTDGKPERKRPQSPASPAPPAPAPAKQSGAKE